MRILHLTNYLPHAHDFWGGAEMACQNIMDLLNPLPEISQAVAANPPQHPIGGKNKFYPVTTISQKYPTSYHYFLRHYWLQKDHLAHRSVQYILKDFKPQLVHFHNFNTLTFSTLDAVKSAGIPAVLSVYDYWYFCPTNMLVDQHTQLCVDGHGGHCLLRCIPTQMTRKSQYLKNLPIFTRKHYFARKMAKFNRIIALSHNSKAVMHRFGSPHLPVDVVRLPVSSDGVPTPAQVDPTPTIMYAGWVQARKGPDIIVRAMPEVANKFPDVSLDLVGTLSESKFEAYIRGLIKDLGLEKHVHIRGKLPQDAFNAVFHNSRVVVIAEQWENMSPVFLIESMLAGKAIISGHIGGIPEFITHETHGLLADYNQPEDFAEKIIYMLENPERAAQMGENAKRNASRMCAPDMVLKDLLACYQRAGSH